MFIHGFMTKEDLEKVCMAKKNGSLEKILVTLMLDGLLDSYDQPASINMCDASVRILEKTGQRLVVELTLCLVPSPE